MPATPSLLISDLSAPDRDRRVAALVAVLGTSYHGIALLEQLARGEVPPDLARDALWAIAARPALHVTDRRRAQAVLAQLGEGG